MIGHEHQQQAEHAAQPEGADAGAAQRGRDGPRQRAQHGRRHQARGPVTARQGGNCTRGGRRNDTGLARRDDGRLTYLDTFAVHAALRHDLVPLVQGDVALDTVRGGTIVSTEDVFEYLAAEIQPAWVLLAGEVSGVYADVAMTGRAIATITPDNVQAYAAALGGSHGADVTGGMLVNGDLGVNGNIYSLNPTANAGVQVANNGLSITGATNEVALVSDNNGVLGDGSARLSMAPTAASLLVVNEQTGNAHGIEVGQNQTVISGGTSSTSLTLDDDVAARLQAESRRTGRPFKAIVNEYLRAGLARRRAAPAAPAFRVEPVHLGEPIPGRSYDRIGALLEEVEDAQHR